MTKPVLSFNASTSNDTVFLEVENEGRFQFQFITGNGPSLATMDFVIWAALPFAMRKGVDIHVKGLVSERVVHAASALSNVWEKWLPYHFTRARVTADEVTTETKQAKKKCASTAVA